MSQGRGAEAKKARRGREFNFGRLAEAPRVNVKDSRPNCFLYKKRRFNCKSISVFMM